MLAECLQAKTTSYPLFWFIPPCRFFARLHGFIFLACNLLPDSGARLRGPYGRSLHVLGSRLRSRACRPQRSVENWRYVRTPAGTKFTSERALRICYRIRHKDVLTIVTFDVDLTKWRHFLTTRFNMFQILGPRLQRAFGRSRRESRRSGEAQKEAGEAPGSEGEWRLGDCRVAFFGVCSQENGEPKAEHR